MTSSVIFIGSPEHSKKTSYSFLRYYAPLFYISPKDLFFRVLISFIPPVGKAYQKVYVDFLGPILGILILTLFLCYSYSFKHYQHYLSPVNSVLGFGVCMPLLCLLLIKLGRSPVNLYETISLVGYALYGHILTLITSFIFFDEKSNFFFFLCLIVFGGLSTLRLVLIFLRTIPVPGARLLICTTISLVNILFLIFLHFAFLHRTFGYKWSNDL